MILLIDNYDSFTHNLYQALGQLDPEIKVVRNDAVTIAQIRELAPELLVISPGPGYPKNAGISLDAIRTFAGIIPIFGVCLGHQSIVQAFGGRIVRAGQLMHGKASTITLDTDCPLFAGLPRQVEAARYHSLIAQEVGLPDCLKITARDETGQIMAVQHKQFPVFGVQFHPESVLTEVGGQILKNLLDYLNDLRRNSPKTALKSYLAQVVEGKDLTRQQAEQVMNILMSGQAEESQIGSFLTALRMKGCGKKPWRSGVAPMPSTLWAPAGTCPTPLTSPLPPPLWWRAPGDGWPSTETAACPAAVALPTCWKPWGSRST